MQITETTNEGLKRAYALTIPASDIEAKIDAEVKKVAPQVKMPGFRPGKVPANLIRKMHGEAIHADVVQNAVARCRRWLDERQGAAPRACNPRSKWAKGMSRARMPR